MTAAGVLLRGGMLVEQAEGGLATRVGFEPLVRKPGCASRCQVIGVSFVQALLETATYTNLLKLPLPSTRTTRE
jgi:hypothetical protein